MTLPAPGESRRLRMLVRAGALERIRRGWLWRADCLTTHGAFEAVAFESPVALDDVVSTPSVIEATVVGTSRGFQLEDVDPHPEDAGEPEDHLPRGPLDEETAWEELVDIVIERVTHPDLARLAAQLVTDEEFARRFRLSPAALTVHHPWRGGLLEHVLSMLQSAPVLCESYGADTSIVTLGILLHDIGKLWEIDAVAGRYTTDGELIGHLVRGTTWLDARLRELEVDPDVARELLHCVVAHHGEIDRGSPRPPMSAEAVVVHTLDRLDSEMFQIRSAGAGLTPGAVSPRNPWLGRKVYRSVM